MLLATTNRTRPNLEMARRRVAAIKAELARGGIHERRIDVEFISATSDSSARIVMMEIVSAPNCGS
jgi:hypothetical protein